MRTDQKYCYSLGTVPLVMLGRTYVAPSPATAPAPALALVLLPWNERSITRACDGTLSCEPLGDLVIVSILFLSLCTVSMFLVLYCAVRHSMGRTSTCMQCSSGREHGSWCLVFGGWMVDGVYRSTVLLSFGPCVACHCHCQAQLEPQPRPKRRTRTRTRTRMHAHVPAHHA